MMEPITGFIAIVQLIALYNELVKSRELDEKVSFEDFLKQRKHQEILDLISNTHHLQEEVNILLRGDHDLILSKIAELNKVTMAIAAQLESFKPMVKSLTPEYILPEDRLPEQALHIMFSLVKRNQHGFELIKVMRGDIISSVPHGHSLTINEREFLHEDCDLLVSLGYLKYNYNSQMERWNLTRQGVDFGKTLLSLDEQ